MVTPPKCVMAARLMPKFELKCMEMPSPKSAAYGAGVLRHAQPAPVRVVGPDQLHGAETDRFRNVAKRDRDRYIPVGHCRRTGDSSQCCALQQPGCCDSTNPGGSAKRTR